jgi:hypothetical protein
MNRSTLLSQLNHGGNKNNLAVRGRRLFVSGGMNTLPDPINNFLSSVEPLLPLDKMKKCGARPNW